MKHQTLLETVIRPTLTVTISVRRHLFSLIFLIFPEISQHQENPSTYRQIRNRSDNVIQGVKSLAQVINTADVTDVKWPEFMIGGQKVCI